MSDEKSFLIFLVVGIVITLLAVIFIFATNPTMTKWLGLTLQLVRLQVGNIENYIMEATF